MIKVKRDLGAHPPEIESSSAGVHSALGNHRIALASGHEGKRFENQQPYSDPTFTQKETEDKRGEVG